MHNRCQSIMDTELSLASGKPNHSEDARRTLHRNLLAGWPLHFYKVFLCAFIACAVGMKAGATENLPRIPFGESARLPEPNQFVITPWYNYSVFRKLWIGDKKTSIEMQPQQDFELND